MNYTEFFEGLDCEGVEAVLNEYRADCDWEVKHMGVEKGRFWMLMTLDTEG